MGRAADGPVSADGTPGLAPRADESGLRAAAERLGGFAEALGAGEWALAAWAIAVAPSRPAAMPPVPTYRDLTIGGVELVERLAAAGRWAEAEVQAGHLLAYFRTARRDAHAVAIAGFDGLRAAARARDPQELRDFADLLGELVA